MAESQNLPDLLKLLALESNKKIEGINQFSLFRDYHALLTREEGETFGFNSNLTVMLPTLTTSTQHHTRTLTQ